MNFFSATGPMSVLLGGTTLVVLAGVTLSPPPVEAGVAPAVALVSVATPLPAGGDDSGPSGDDDLFSTGAGTSGADRHQNGFSGRGFSERQEREVRQEKQESYFDGWFDGFDAGQDVGSSAPAGSGDRDHDRDKSDKSDFSDELEDFQDDLKKIAKSQGDSSGGDHSNGNSSREDNGDSAEAGSGQGWISALLAAIGQFVSAMVSITQGSGQG